MSFKFKHFIQYFQMFSVKGAYNEGMAKEEMCPNMIILNKLMNKH